MDTTSPTSRKNNDCYFYYYSTCLKGDGCSFRHEAAALGSETVCSFWAQGKCLNQHCNFRHMELKKNRKTIPCYWETQPSGCQKPHCSFQHKNPRPGVPGETDLVEGEGVSSPLDRPDYRPRRSLPVDGGESSEGEGSRRLNQNLDFNTTTVDPLVVNFEEESDNESVPTSTPTKNTNTIHVKTLEEIRLERIQAESAAFYHYDDSELPWLEPKEEGRIRVLSLDEIRRKSSKMDVDAYDSNDRTVKTLTQIRAERKARERLKEKWNNDEDSDGSGFEWGIKRRKPVVARNYKKRSHSPIKFDISYAEPSVSSSTDSVKRNKCQINSCVPMVNLGGSPVPSPGQGDYESSCNQERVNVSSSISVNPPAVKLRRQNDARAIIQRLRRKPNEVDVDMVLVASTDGQIELSNSTINDSSTSSNVLSQVHPNLLIGTDASSDVQMMESVNPALPDGSADNQPTVSSVKSNLLDYSLPSCSLPFDINTTIPTSAVVASKSTTMQTACNLLSPVDKCESSSIPDLSKSCDRDDLLDEDILSSSIRPANDILQDIDDLLND